MKRTGKPIFFIVAALILILSYLSFFGVSWTDGDITHTILKGAQDIRFGIDIRGGVEATYSPDTEEPATAEQMKAAEAILNVRLTTNGITDYEIYPDAQNNRIIVRFPWKSDEADFNPEVAVDELGATAALTFRELCEVDDDGLPTGTTAEKVVLQGGDISKASAMVATTDSGQQYVVSLELTSEGAKKFGEATTRLIGSQISIWMDDQLISAPTVETAITDGNAQISGSFTAEEASDLANKINAGSLPFRMKVTNFGKISPTLGAAALETMLLAALLAFVIISLFMIIYYRVPGFVAVIALLGQVAGILVFVSGFFPVFSSFTLTIPGIAGIILSIGMGVDANVITIERIKEELQNGKTVDSAITAASKESFSAIFDGNISNIIVAVILMGVFGPPDGFFASLLKPFVWFFGTSTSGIVYSFGYTLLIGVVFNFVMGVTASRLMLSSLAQFKPFRNKTLYRGGTVR